VSRLALVALLWAALAAGGDARAETLVVDGDVVHTVAGKPIASGRVVVEDGRIARVGPAASTPAPDGARRLRAAVVTPGFIDSHTSVGLSGALNVPGDQDQDETSDPNQAHLRALDAFNPDEPLLRFVLEHGVTLVQAGPGPATPVAGLAGIFRTHGETADAMAVKPVSALVFNLGEDPKEAFGKERKLPVTRMGTAALLRRALLDGREYAAARGRAKAVSASGAEGANGGDKSKLPDRDLKREALARAAAGDLPAIFVAQRADDILTAIRIAGEYNLRFAIAGAAEGWLVSDALRDAGAPVLLGPVMERPAAIETLNASYENAARLADAGVRIAIRSGFESYVPKNRVVLFEAAVAAANGLGFDRALRAITLDAAEILGVEELRGSLEAGKVADLVLFDADPFEYTSHVVAVIAGGEVVHERKAEAGASAGVAKSSQAATPAAPSR
jgi:imidazolonepropionase-like amidohydrolase